MNRADKRSTYIVLGAVVFMILWWIVGETSFIEEMGETGQTIISLIVLAFILGLVYLTTKR